MTEIMQNSVSKKSLTPRQRIENLFEQPEYKDKILSIFGGNIVDVERQISKTMIYFINKKLTIEPDQFFKIALQSFELRVPLDSEVLSHVVNYSGNWQLSPTFKGYRKVAIEYGNNIADVTANVVYEGDTFEFGDSSDKGEYYMYKANLTSGNYGQKDKIVCAYSVIRYKDGHCKCQVMSLAQLLEVRSMSKSEQAKKKDPSKLSPYDKTPEEMYKKIVGKRNLKLEYIEEITKLDEIDNQEYNIKNVTAIDQPAPTLEPQKITLPMDDILEEYADDIESIENIDNLEENFTENNNE